MTAPLPTTPAPVTIKSVLTATVTARELATPEDYPHFAILPAPARPEEGVPPEVVCRLQTLLI